MPRHVTSSKLFLFKNQKTDTDVVDDEETDGIIIKIPNNDEPVIQEMDLLRLYPLTA